MEIEIVTNGVVVSLDYTLTVDGAMVDSSGDQPLEYIHGYNNIIPGLEKELNGLKLGESKDVVVAPQDAYGIYHPEALFDLPRSQFPPNFPVEIGRELRVRSENGQVMTARISQVETDTVQIDTNHPLAGKELFFHAKISSLRPATQNELANGRLGEACTCGSSCGDGCGDSCASGGCG